MVSSILITHLKRYSLYRENSLYFLSSSEAHQHFESVYYQVREQEERLYSDEIVQQLPWIDPKHRWSQEWRIRQYSCRLLTHYLKKKFQQDGWFRDSSSSNTEPPLVLEVGCGNGWLAHQLSQLSRIGVYGLDIHQYELQQATRIFGNKKNLTFIYGNLFENILPLLSFDIIILGSAIQYFPKMDLLLNRLLQLLKPQGEIHIFDSPVYSTEQIPLAQQRSLAYYQSIGHSALANYYFHHSYSGLTPFHPDFLYNPDSWGSRLKRKLFPFVGFSPFPWIRFIKEDSESKN